MKFFLKKQAGIEVPFFKRELDRVRFCVFDLLPKGIKKHTKEISTIISVMF